MAIRKKDEILESLRTRIGDNTDDDTISFIEDVSDTLNDYEEKVNDSTDWKTRYEENDKKWRKKYTERFFSNDPNNNDDNLDNTGENNNNEKPTTFDDLFKEG